MRILEEFWYGNIEPTEYDTSSCKEYKKLLELICRNEEKLKATMTDEQKDLFEKFVIIWSRPLAEKSNTRRNRSDNSFPSIRFHSYPASSQIGNLPPQNRKDNFYMNEKKNRNYTVKENGNIVVHNYCAAALPKITVTIHSGQTTYRFNGSYDGTRSLSGKLLDHMAKDN